MEIEKIDLPFNSAMEKAEIAFDVSMEKIELSFAVDLLRTLAFDVDTSEKGILL